MPVISITDLREELLKRLLARGRAKKTRTQVIQVLRELEAVGVADSGDITDSAIDDWILAWPDRTPVTFQSHLRCLSGICTVARKRGWIAIDPFADDPPSAWMRLDSRPSPPRRLYAKLPDETRRLLRQGDLEAQDGGWEARRLQAYVHTLFLTGARPGEIQRLETTDIDRVAKTIHIHPKWVPDSKGKLTWWAPKTVGSAAEQPIGDHLVEMLLDWSIRLCHPYRRRYRACTWLFPGKRLLGPWVTGGPGCNPLDQVKALALRAGIGPTWQKSARKNIGTHREIGLTPQGRRDVFRHSDIPIGDRYDELQVESRRADAQKIEKFYLFGT